MTANVTALSNCMNTSFQQIKTVLSSVNSNHKNDKLSSVKAISTNLHSKVLNSQQNICRSKIFFMGGGGGGDINFFFILLIFC